MTEEERKELNRRKNAHRDEWRKRRKQMTDEFVKDIIGKVYKGAPDYGDVPSELLPYLKRFITPKTWEARFGNPPFDLERLEWVTGLTAAEIARIVFGDKDYPKGKIIGLSQGGFSRMPYDVYDNMWRLMRCKCYRDGDAIVWDLPTVRWMPIRHPNGHIAIYVPEPHTSKGGAGYVMTLPAKKVKERSRKDPMETIILKRQPLADELMEIVLPFFDECEKALAMTPTDKK